MVKLTFFSFFIVSSFSFAQNWTSFKLNESLHEISGLEQLNEETLAAINDSGNSAEIHLINLKGELIKSVLVKNATNVDWEDLARDNHYLYIGDIGNNQNNRKDLCVYKVKISELLSNTEVNAQKIIYHYANQSAFPPTKEDFNFDAEGIIAYKESLFIFTKNKTEPWNGISTIYSIPKQPGTYKAKKYAELYVGEQGWWQDAITGVDIFQDVLYILTYNRFFTINFADLDRNASYTHEFKRITQKEAIVVIDKNTVFFGDEVKRFVGGGNLYKFEK